MMRKLAVALAFAGALGNNFANAVGLGELKLNSALNQKFDAEIKLLNIGDLSKNEILPNLASHEDFARAGVERVFFLTGVKFDVRFADDGSAFIKLTSDKIVREPFLNFLVELHWPSGRILREYTVLLDPPAFSEAPAAKVTEASSGGSSEQLKKKVSQPQATRPYTPSGSVSTSSRTSGASEGSVRVKKHDTLWGIAKANRPSQEVTVRQTMLAIQRHNPKAFINNNINLLKAGQVLRIPNVDQIRSLSAYEVDEEIARQNQAWQQNRTIDASQEDDFADQQSGTTGDDDYTASGQLKLLSDDSDSPENLASNASGASLESEDGSDHAGGSGVSDLSADETDGGTSSGQVEALREQVDSLQRLLTLKDEQLAMLQAGQSGDGQLAEVTAGSLAGDYQTDDVVNADQPGAGMDDSGAVSVSQGEGAEAAEVEESVAAEVEAEQAEPVAEAEKSVPAKEASKPEQGLVATLMDNPIYIGLMLLGILIVLLVMGAISRRKNAERDYPDDLREAINAAQTDVDLPSEPDEEDEEAVAESAAQDEPEMDPETQQREAAIRKLVEEADIYIAYGRYERAMEMLQPAVNENPRAVALRLKLVEVFLATGDEAGLSQQEADLVAIGDQEALQKLAALKAEAQEPAEGSAADDVEESDNLDEQDSEANFDRYDDEESDMPFEELGAEPEDELSDGVEFTLDDDAVSENAEAKDESSNAELTEGLGDNELEEVDLEEATDDMDFLADTDEVATKLELGRAYIDMADKDAAVDILNEVVEDGNEEQKEEAKRLLQSIAS